MGSSMLRMLVGCALLLWGCGSSDDLTPGTLELGTGESSFEAIPADRHLPLHAGTQGGHHVWLSLRGRGLDRGHVVMTLDVEPEESSPPAHTEVELELEPSPVDPDGFEFVGWPARVLSAECAVGKRVRLTVSLEDDSGRTAEAQVEVIADPPKAGFSAPCEVP